MTKDTQAALPAPDAQDTAAEHQAQPAPNESLAALANEAAALDGAPAAKEAEQTRAVAVKLADTNKAELHAVLVMVRKAALPLIALASQRKAAMLAAIWSDDAVSAIAADGADVLALHGIRLDNMVSGFGPYVALALSAGPVALGTYAVLKSPDPQPVEEVAGGQQQ